MNPFDPLRELQKATGYGVYFKRSPERNEWTITNRTPIPYPDLYWVDDGPPVPYLLLPGQSLVIKGNRVVFWLAFLFTTIMEESV
ncbi:hypothetical protein LCGC14_2117720 [marine sediment metagenome]|uniref:Uncharacterized protein n=1 Tax=marine sediment metagenome TaxID=412755 RepID=A0A0F9E572_9ZZZZ